MQGSAPGGDIDRRAAEFTRLHVDVAPRIWTWVAVHLGTQLRASVDPEDVVQEVSCRAWRRFSEFDPERGTFLAWSFGIARNVLGELLARIARNDARSGAWSTARWAQVPDDATRATVRIAKEEHLGRFVEWADTLDEQEQLLLLHRGLEGWSHAETGDLLGISENACQKRWADLTARMRIEPRVADLLALDSRS